MNKSAVILLLPLLINILYIGIIVIEIRAIKNWRKLQSTNQAKLQLTENREIAALRILLLAVIVCSVIFSVIYTGGADPIFGAAKYALLFTLAPPYCVFLVFAVILLIKSKHSDKENNCLGC